MRQISLFILTVIILTSLGSCRKIIGTGPVVSETRAIPDHSEIDFGVPGRLVYIESDKNEIELVAQDNIIDVIEAYVSGDALKIRVRGNYNIKSSENIIVTVRSPSVHSLVVSGSGELETLDTFDPIHAKLRVNGSGRMVIGRIASETLEAKISGSGTIDVFGGAVDREDISLSGSGSINLLDVDAIKATTQTSGSGNIRLRASEALDVRISGSGNVFYSGEPAVNVSVSGSGRAIKL